MLIEASRHARGLSDMSELKTDAPRRYMVDRAGRHVLIGLTIEETIEFERLDSPAARRLHNGHVPWNTISRPLTRTISRYGVSS